MDNFKEIRWQERFTDFNKAFCLLGKALDRQEVDEIYRAGIIQIFEFTFELAWKTLKDFLESQGYSVKSPRETILQAFQYGIISEGHLWIDALDKRNLLAHSYEEELSIEAENLIRNKYYSILNDLLNFFKSKMK